MKVLRKQIEDLSSLAKLEFHDKEMEDIIESLSVVIDYVSLLKEVDIEGVEESFRLHEYDESMREDMIGNSLDKEQTFLNTENHVEGYFKVSL